MQAIHIFRAGRHTSANGATLEFGEDTLRAAAAAYDPARHEAPLVVGHPRDNGPAYGWVGALSYDENGLHAAPTQLDADFAELVRAGRFKKVSASFYTPDSPANPVPGTYYLRHVGFLGAQPPALKGLKAASFSDNEQGVIEFSGEWEMATFFRRFREWFIDKFSREEADQVIPAHIVEAIEAEARQPVEAESEAMPVQTAAAFSETAAEESPMTADQIAALEKRAAEAEAALAARDAEFSEREARFAAAERDQRRAQTATSIDALISEGRVLPAQREGLVAFMDALPAETVVEFGEGETATKQAGREYVLGFLRSLPKAVEFGERAARDPSADAASGSADEIARRAVDFQEAEAKAGRRISTAEAVTAVIAGRAS
jgi:hypothetical protein